MGCSLYADLVEAGCEIDNHYSDLYVKVTDESMEIVNRWAGMTELFGKYFTCEITGKLWIDIPFMYDPYWTERGFTHDNLHL